MIKDSTNVISFETKIVLSMSQIKLVKNKVKPFFFNYCSQEEVQSSKLVLLTFFLTLKLGLLLHKHTLDKL